MSTAVEPGTPELDGMPDPETRVDLVGKLKIDGVVKVGDLISVSNPVFVVRSAGRKHRAGADDPISDPKASAQLSTWDAVVHTPTKDELELD